MIGTAVLEGGNTSPFELKRTGEPKVVTLPRAPLLAAGFERDVEAHLEVPDRTCALAEKACQSPATARPPA